VRGVVRWLLLAVALVVVTVAACAALVAPSVWRATHDGRTALLEGARAVQRKDAAAARAEFASARDLFASASARLDSAWVVPLRLFPVASTHTRVSESLVRIGSAVSDAGKAVTDAMDELPEPQLALQGGQLDLTLARRAARALGDGVSAASVVREAIDEMPGGWVSGPLAEPRRRVLTTLPGVIDGVRKAEAALAGLPTVLGDGVRKRYLIAFSNLSELRGSGGLFGYVTGLTAADGQLSLDDLSGRPTEIFPAPGEVGLNFPSWFPDDFRKQAELFQNINMTTDFPTVGRFVLETAQRRTGDLDGVIALDPVGVSAILGMTGPVRVPLWRGEINAQNAVQIAIHDVYVEIADREERERFFEQLVRTAFGRLVASRVALTPAAVGAFDVAVQGGHFRMFSKHERDQRVFERIGASGGVDRAAHATDVLSVVSQNAAGSKADWYLRREIRYRVRLDPGDRSADTTLGVALRNQAPKVGLPRYITGSRLAGLEAGTNRQIVMLVRSPADRLGSFAIGRSAASNSPANEGELRAYRASVDIAAGSHAEVEAISRVPDAIRASGDALVYRLHVLRQAVANADFADIEIHVPAGYQASGRTTFLGDLTSDVTLEVRLVRTSGATIFERFVAAPWRAVADAVRRLF
jgi:hypothetical protein